MLTSIFNKNYSFFNNYFKIYDINGRKLILSILIILITFIKTIVNPVPASYIIQIKNQFKLQGFDIFFEYIIPLLTLIVIIYVFFYDYKDETYKMIEFYNKGNFNYIMIFRFIIPIGIITLGSFISGLFYYREISFLDIKNILLSIRFIPNIIFISSLFLFITSITKNIYAGILTSSTYIIIDYFSSGHMFKILSIGANMNNFYYCYSPLYYFINRVLIILLGILFLLISYKKTKINI